jgi:hypothetical protein
LHGSVTFPDTWRHSLEAPRPISLADVPVGTIDIKSGTPADIPVPAPDEKAVGKKRGFWSRLAGVFKRGG